MNISTLYEITSNDRLLNSLGLAIAEARMTRSLLRARKISVVSARGSGTLAKLSELDREIDYLEAKLLEVQSKLNRGEQVRTPNPDYA